MDKYDIILSDEEQFAREVTLGVIVQQPLTGWFYLMPGMFIIDFLRRTTAIRRYTKHFMFPRRLAIDAARDLLKGYDNAAVSSRIFAEIENWLNSLHLYSPQLAEAQKHAVDLLITHYSRLLDAEGNSHHELIENAYRSCEAYEAHVSDLTSAEAQIDRSIIEKIGNNEKLKKKLQMEARQVEIGRKKILQNIF